jgi:preprotein translocase subunit SecG
VQILITILHIVACVVLIFVVLLQAGKGASMGAAFGGSSQTLFGSSGPGTFLGKMTSVIAIVFMLTSLALSYTSLHKGSALMGKEVPQAQQQSAPAPADKVPGAPADQQAPPAQQK